MSVQPQYTPLVQWQAASTRSIRRWTPETEEALRDCYNITDWDVLLGAHDEDIDGMTHCLTDYLNFCVDVVVPTKTVRCYPNNKPWITQKVKDVLNRKKKAFKTKDKEEMKDAQKEVKRCLKEAKESYRRKVEKKLGENSMRDVWTLYSSSTGKGRCGGCRPVSTTPSPLTSGQGKWHSEDPLPGFLRCL